MVCDGHGYVRPTCAPFFAVRYSVDTGNEQLVHSLFHIGFGHIVLVAVIPPLRRLSLRNNS